MLTNAGKKPYVPAGFIVILFIKLGLLDRVGFGCSGPIYLPAFVSIRQNTSAYVSIRQHTSVYVSSIRQHTSAHTCLHVVLNVSGGQRDIPKKNPKIENRKRNTRAQEREHRLMSQIVLKSALKKVKKKDKKHAIALTKPRLARNLCFVGAITLC